MLSIFIVLNYEDIIEAFSFNTYKLNYNLYFTFTIMIDL